jgi:hypothetical protein
MSERPVIVFESLTGRSPRTMTNRSVTVRDRKILPGPPRALYLLSSAKLIDDHEPSPSSRRQGFRAWPQLVEYSSSTMK